MSYEKVDWKRRGKTIKDLIEELESFEDKDLKVELSWDEGLTSSPISVVGKKDGRCLLFSIFEEKNGGAE